MLNNQFLFPFLARCSQHKWLLMGGMVCFVLLNACSVVQPFVDTRREAGQVHPIGYSRPENPAVCYNAWVSLISEVDILAEEVCHQTGKRAVFREEWGFSCRLMTPSVRFYDCQP